jgi:hypothetical protein
VSTVRAILAVFGDIYLDICGIIISIEELAMPLRDHFRPPVDLKHSWDELHGMWPGTIVQHLFTQLPHPYVAGPIVHLTTPSDMIVAYTRGESCSPASDEGDGGDAVATRTLPPPTFALETDLPDQEEYEVRIYDQERGTTLVAAIEIVSPSNKHRADRRRAFVARIAALLQKGVCVSIVDVVTVRQFNLYAELLELIGKTDPALGAEPPSIYAVTLRGRKRIRKQPVLENWYYPLQLGQQLPPLPIWLDIDLGLSLDLEATYEDACRVLHIR